MPAIRQGPKSGIGSQRVNATGTIMKNRLPKDCIMSSDRDFVKKMRGPTEINCREDGKIAITKWLDNKPVILASTCLSDASCDTCKRWNKRTKEYQFVRRPEVIRQYNTNMGGVDLADRMLAVCPARSRTRKWTIRFIFQNACYLSVSNAWILYRKRQFSQNIPHHKVEKLTLTANPIKNNPKRTKWGAGIVYLGVLRTHRHR
ncbi:Transposase IS4 [Popillia japonica]|uniref:Transposase IS4 n=1 Tax=Popillia japonica TaxID=7064 RepID=A0AAW1KHP1_POPJA